jgi:hypothetical protein
MSNPEVPKYQEVWRLYGAHNPGDDELPQKETPETIDQPLPPASSQDKVDIPDPISGIFLPFKR